MNIVRTDNQGNPVMWQDNNKLYVKINDRFAECDQNGNPISQNKQQQRLEVVEEDNFGNAKVVTDGNNNFYAFDNYGNLQQIQYQPNNVSMNNGFNFNNQIRNDYQNNNNDNIQQSFGMYNHSGNNNSQSNTSSKPRKYQNNNDFNYDQNCNINTDNFVDAPINKNVKDNIKDLSKYKALDNSLFIPLTNDKTENVDIIIRDDNKSYTYKIIKK